MGVCSSSSIAGEKRELESTIHRSEHSVRVHAADSKRSGAKGDTSGSLSQALHRVGEPV